MPQGRITILPSDDFLSDLFDLGLVEETGLMIRNEKFGCLIHPKSRKDFVHVERLVASTRLYIKDLIVMYSHTLRLHLKLLILSDPSAAHSHCSKRVVERQLACRFRDTYGSFASPSFT